MEHSKHISDKFSVRSGIAIPDYPSVFPIGNLKFKFCNIIWKNSDHCLYSWYCSDFQFGFWHAVPDLSTFNYDHHSDLLHVSPISSTQLRHGRIALWPHYCIGTFFAFSLPSLLVCIRCLFIYNYCLEMRRTPPRWTENMSKFKLKISLL